MRATLNRPITLGPEGVPPAELLLFPAGEFSTEAGIFTFSEESARLVMQEHERMGNRRSADWEHASFAEPPAPAPASAWYDLELKNSSSGPELWATNVEWTPKAFEQLQAREYRYHSPAFESNERGEVTGFINFGLTNTPATHHLMPLVANRQNGGKESMTTETNKLNTIALALGSSSLAEADLLSSIQTLRRAAEQLKEIKGILPDGVDAVGHIRALSEKAARADDLEEQAAAAEKQRKAEQVERLMADAMKAGKVTQASSKGLLEALAGADGIVEPARLESYLAVAPRIVPVTDAKPGGDAPPPQEPTSDDAVATLDRIIQKATDQGYAALSNIEKHQLATGNRELFTQLRSQHIAGRAGFWREIS